MTAFMPLSLASKQQLLTQHYEQLDEAVIIIDADKRYLSVNGAYERLIGYSEDKLLGQPFVTSNLSFLTEHNSAALHDMSNHLAQHNLYKNSFILLSNDQQTLNCDITFQKLAIETTVYYVGSINKVSTAIVAEAQSKYLLNDDSTADSITSEMPSTGLANPKQLFSQAIAANQFIAHYQPKVRLETGTIVGFEALVRWQHPTRGLLKPKDFIDDIIHYNLSLELFCQLSEQIAQLLTQWQAMGFTQHICINADAAEFSNPKFNSVVSSLLQKYDIDPYQLHIEMTESSLMPCSGKIKQRLIELKGLKVCLALDDFGTGYASLSYLQKYPFDYIKIDKSFVSQLSSDKTQQAIVKAILDLAIALDMQAVAEGIETQQQYELLQEMGCKYGQGYWLGRPISGEVATQLLKNQKH